MQIEIKRRTGFFGMGSPIQLMQKQQRIASIAHEEAQILMIDPLQPLTVKLFILRSQPYMVKQRGGSVKLEIVLNPLLKRFYFTSYIIFFVFAGLSGLFYTHGWLWLLLIILIVIYGIGLRFYLAHAFLIKEVE